MLIIEDAKIESLANKLGTLPELTHTNIDKYLMECSIQDISTKSRTVGLGYIFGDSKAKRIYKCFINEFHKTNNDLKIVSFIERALDPSRFADSKRYDEILKDINSVLLFMGCEIGKSGKVKIVKKATTIDEVQERINALGNEARKRNVHSEVLKYCKREYLDKDYFHAQFEASKGLFQRIRDLTNQNVDGTKLINGVFSTEEPMLILPNLKLTDRTDKDEFLGYKHLFEYVINAVRNPEGHTPRILASEELGECLDNFVIISRCHRFLDNCSTTCYTYTKKLQ